MEALLSLAATFAMLSLLAVGGGTAVLPEMQRSMATLGIGSDQFLEVYSLGQLAPGPNMLMVVVLGDRVAGPAGALVALLAFFVPASMLAFVVGRLWDRVGESPWRLSVQRGLAPVSIGLMATGIHAIGVGAITGPVPVAIAVGVGTAMLRTRLHPALLIAAAAATGVALLGG